MKKDELDSAVYGILLNGTSIIGAAKNTWYAATYVVDELERMYLEGFDEKLVRDSLKRLYREGLLDKYLSVGVVTEIVYRALNPVEIVTHKEARARNITPKQLRGMKRMGYELPQRLDK